MMIMNENFDTDADCYDHCHEKDEHDESRGDDESHGDDDDNDDDDDDDDDYNDHQGYKKRKVVLRSQLVADAPPSAGQALQKRYS